MSSVRQYKYLEIITIAFVVIIMVSNLVGSIKVCRFCFGDFCFSTTSGLILFPASYLIGDILTEVYGYDKSRKVIWSGFASLLAANLLIQLFKILPADPQWGLQAAYEQIFNQSLRVSIASMLAFFCGEFTNSFVLAKMKVWFEGKFLILRLVGSTIAGELVDSLILYPLAFFGAPGFSVGLVVKIMITNYILKVLWEILVYPLTKKLLSFLKRTETEDYYDYKTDFNPFKLS